MSRFESDKAGVAVARWWRGLQPAGERRGDPGTLARLRRAESPGAALMVPEVQALLRQIAQECGAELSSGAPWVEPAAVAAGVLAFARGAGRARFAEALGAGGPDRPLYSGLRFTALMRARDWPERMLRLRRAVRRLEASGVHVDIARFAGDLFRWQYAPDAVGRQWIFEYHQAASVAPGAGQAAQKDEVS